MINIKNINNRNKECGLANNMWVFIGFFFNTKPIYNLQRVSIWNIKPAQNLQNYSQQVGLRVGGVILSSLQ